MTRVMSFRTATRLAHTSITRARGLYLLLTSDANRFYNPWRSSDMIHKPLTRTLPVLAITVLLLSSCGNSTSVDTSSTASPTLESTTTESQIATETPVDISQVTMTVYKSPACGCCHEWVDYMKAEGFSVTAVDTDDVGSIKAEHGLTSPKLQSCHTALVDGYLIEGHVPVNDVRRLLNERPRIVGLTAPGMPMMSPGMASLTPKDYDVLAFQEDGRTRIWSTY